MALEEANKQANMSLSKSCNAVQDMFQYNPILCKPYLQNLVKLIIFRMLRNPPAF